MADISQETLLSRAEYAAALYMASVADPNRAGNSLARRMTREVLREVLGRMQFGTTFPAPADAVEGDLFFLTAPGRFETSLGQLTRSGDTADIGSRTDVVCIHFGNLAITATLLEATPFILLASGDRILLRADSGDDVVFTLSGAPTMGVLREQRGVFVLSRNYTQRGEIVDGTIYTVYALKSRPEAQGSIFEFDGNFYTRVFENAVSAANIADNMITIEKLATGTAGALLGYDTAGNPAVVDRRSLDFGTTFPADPVPGDVFIFTAAVSSGLTWKDTDGTTDLTAASRTDVAQYNGIDWVKQLTLNT